MSLKRILCEAASLNNAFKWISMFYLHSSSNFFHHKQMFDRLATHHCQERHASTNAQTPVHIAKTWKRNIFNIKENKGDL